MPIYRDFPDTYSHEAAMSSIKRYAMPLTIDIAGYVRRHRLPLLRTEHPEEATLVYRTYGFGKFFQEDTVVESGVTSSRVLQPSLTDEEVTLGPVCEAHFRQQQAMGLPTVF